MEKRKLVLEQSANPHVIEADHIEVIHKTEDVVTMKVAGQGLVMHGEHGTLVTEVENVAKYVQQEYNPVTQMLQKAFD